MLTPMVFISHGALDIVLKTGSPTLEYWQTLGQTLPRPQAIVLVSAQWTTNVPTFSTAEEPETLHDFEHFPDVLYQMQYPAHGAPDLSQALATCLIKAQIPLHWDPNRGLDHGAWIPLQVMYPQADIPVAQLSIQAHEGPAWHLHLGAALRPLREQGIMIIATGAVTHNVDWLSKTKKPFPKAKAFSEWLQATMSNRDIPALLNYRHLAPYGAEAHPTEEHLLPLFVALGASYDHDQLTHANPEYTHGGLAMDVYVWEATDHLQ